MSNGEALPLERLSLNTMTVDQWSLREAAEACARAGLGWIAPWRHKIAEIGADEAARTIAASGLRVSSLCRAGFFPSAPDQLSSRDRDNRAAVEEAAAIGADVLVLVCGPPLGRDLQAARAAIASGIERLLPHARDHGVRLAVEPLHPMMISERSAIVTLAEAIDLAERFDAADVGVIVDVYHVFWDADVGRQIVRAGDRILGFHVSDWLTPDGDVVACRAMIGEGTIDIRALRRQVEAAGYSGPVEVEVVNARMRSRPGEEILARMLDAFHETV